MTGNVKNNKKVIHTLGILQATTLRRCLSMAVWWHGAGEERWRRAGARQISERCAVRPSYRFLLRKLKIFPDTRFQL